MNNLEESLVCLINELLENKTNIIKIRTQISILEGNDRLEYLLDLLRLIVSDCNLKQLENPDIFYKNINLSITNSINNIYKIKYSLDNKINKLIKNITIINKNIFIDNNDYYFKNDIENDIFIKYTNFQNKININDLLDEIKLSLNLFKTNNYLNKIHLNNLQNFHNDNYFYTYYDSIENIIENDNDETYKKLLSLFSNNYDKFGCGNNFNNGNEINKIDKINETIDEIIFNNENIIDFLKEFESNYLPQLICYINKLIFELYDLLKRKNNYSILNDYYLTQIENNKNYIQDNLNIIQNKELFIIPKYFDKLFFEYIYFILIDDKIIINEQLEDNNKITNNKELLDLTTNILEIFDNDNKYLSLIDSSESVQNILFKILNLYNNLIKNKNIITIKEKYLESILLPLILNIEQKNNILIDSKFNDNFNSIINNNIYFSGNYSKLFNIQFHIKNKKNELFDNYYYINYVV